MIYAPSMWVFALSLVLAALAIAGVFTPIPFVTMHAFWVAIAAYVVLAFGNLVKT